MPRYEHFDNLQRLWRAHDALTPWATQKIYESDYLPEHIELIETYMGTVEYLRKRLPKGDYHYALGGLFLRTFDQFGHALRAAMTGNYAGSAMYARDLLETHFLINYLMEHPQKAIEWLHSTPAEIRKNFKQVDIRKFLDERDGFEEQKRKQHYQMLSTLGAHPTPHSFELKKDGGGALHSGPLKQLELMEECIQEIAKCCLLLSHDILLFLHEFEDGETIGSRLSIVLQRTHEQYFKKD